MFEKLKGVEKRFLEIEKLLSDPKTIQNRELYQKYAQEHADLNKVVAAYREYKRIIGDLDNSHEMLKDSDPDIKEMARDEIEKLNREKERLDLQIKQLLVPQNPNDDKNIILEIRAGTGGEEAALFVADLFRMYSRYAEMQGWKVEILSHNVTGLGGFKEIIALVEGQQVYSHLKYESGAHRVQRVPSTEAQGRIHTSAVTVAVLPEAEDVEVQINPNDLKVDVFRSSGPGGQSVNTTDSAVRITHLPSGLVVTCQDEKSQHKNKAQALKVLRARLLDKAIIDQQSAISQSRKSQVGTGDRSERIRTYNFPQGRMTDHRIGLTLYKLDSIMGGNLEELIDPLHTHYQSEALKMGGAKN